MLRIRSCPAPEDQFGANELIQRIVYLLLRHHRTSADQLMGELPPKRRPDLCYLTGRSQTIEPCQQ